MWYEEDDCINYDEAPLEEKEEKRRHSVSLETANGGLAEYTMTDRSKKSVVLRHCIEFFAGFEPPMDSVETDRLFEEALVNLCRPEEPDFRGAEDFLGTFRNGPNCGEVRSRYVVETDYFDPSHKTLVAVFHVKVEAALDQVQKTIWTRFLEREAADGDALDVRCVHYINDEEIIYRLKRKKGAPADTDDEGKRGEGKLDDGIFGFGLLGGGGGGGGGAPREASDDEEKTDYDGDATEAVCYSRIQNFYSPVERFVLKNYSIELDDVEEEPGGKCVRLEYPLTGYVVDQVTEDYCMLSFVLEQANFVAGEETDLLQKYASRLANEAQLAVWCSQLESVLEPLDSPRELCSNDSFDKTYPCHC